MSHKGSQTPSILQLWVLPASDTWCEVLLANIGGWVHAGKQSETGMSDHWIHVPIVGNRAIRNTVIIRQHTTTPSNSPHKMSDSLFHYQTN